METRPTPERESTEEEEGDGEPDHHDLQRLAKDFLQPGQIAVTLDKDVKRVCAMSREGYLFRLSESFGAQEGFYEECPGDAGGLAELTQYKDL